MNNFLDITLARKFIEGAIRHYEKAPGWFTNWLNDLYIRLGEHWRDITLDELGSLAALCDEGEWKPEPFAVNSIYKLFDRLGRDTSGIIGY